jgi:hypothetical protein
MNKDWILTTEKRPELGDQVEYSDDGINVEGTMVYIENRTCMSDGHGYFGEGFATDGDNGCDYGLLCDDPKYWRLA